MLIADSYWTVSAGFPSQWMIQRSEHTEYPRLHFNGDLGLSNSRWALTITTVPSPVRSC